MAEAIKMTENTKTVFSFLQAHNGENLVAQDVADAVGLGVRQVNGIFTAALQKDTKGFGFREEATIKVGEGDEAKEKKVKFLKLTEKGLALNLDEVEIRA